MFNALNTSPYNRMNSNTFESPKFTLWGRLISLANLSIGISIFEYWINKMSKLS